MNIAILSPSKNTYSETFIQLQKENLKGNIFYYYDGEIPCKLENRNNFIIKYAGIKRRLGIISQNTRLASLRKSFRNNKIDIVLAQYGPTGNAVCGLCSDLNIPLVTHFHGYDASSLEVIKKNSNYSKLFDSSAKIIAVSKEMLIDLKNLGCPDSKLIYNPCAPSDIFFKTKGLNKISKQFLAVGRFTDKKAPYLTILAFNKVLQKYPKAKLVFGGSGVLLNTCVNLVKYLNISHAVEFKGVISQKDYIKELENSIAFVQHSIKALSGDKEGTPVAILEASAAGIPVISTFHAGIPDVITHKQTGLLCNEGNVEEMAKHMVELLDKPKLAKEMGLKGKKNIANNFNLTKHINTLNAILQESLRD